MQKRSLALMAAGLLLAACSAAPLPSPTLTPTPAPTPTPVVIRLAADGSGDYASLEEAVRNAPPGATILLPFGIYFVDQPLDIDKPIHLIGDGVEESAVVCEAGGYVVRFVGAGPFIAENLTFLHKGDTPADAVVVEGGEANFNRCRFAGAVEGEDLGAGLRFNAAATGVVSASIATQNGSAGILLTDQAQVRLEGNACFENTGLGIAYLGQSGGVARQNRCATNVVGIYVDDEAQPTLLENVCMGNQWDGIAYWGTAGGVARQNRCIQNGEAGVYVGGEAKPLLEMNICTGNKQAGIAYVGDAAGLAHQNDCSENEGHGIVVDERAAPTLERNTCNRNQQAGLAYLGNSAGAARGNECANNVRVGIYVAATANPTLADNNCYGNGEDVQDRRK